LRADKLRYSLKWILAGMVYVANAAAAYSRHEPFFLIALWLLTLAAVVHAIRAAVIAHGRQRVLAASFAIAAVVYLACLAFVDENRMPMTRLLTAAADFQQSPYPKDAWPLTLSMRELSIANAVATLSFGLMGSLAGSLAFRAAGRE
jgi:hypothetical protein